MVRIQGLSKRILGGYNRGGAKGWCAVRIEGRVKGGWWLE